jgi:hypothetical protein
LRPLSYWLIDLRPLYNRRRIRCPKRSSLKNWKGREEGEGPEKDGKMK